MRPFGLVCRESSYHTLFWTILADEHLVFLKKQVEKCPVNQLNCYSPRLYLSSSYCTVLCRSCILPRFNHSDLPSGLKNHFP